jgi:membrane-bound serine protease (ClpP class)
MHHLSLLLLLLALVLFILLPWWVALPTSVPILAFIVFVYWKARQAWRQRPVAGEEAMIGDRAIVSDTAGGQLKIRYRGEVWWAVSAEPLHQGQPVVIECVQGLTLRVAPLAPPTEDEK